MFIQGIFTDYKQPFAVTYLGASLMVVYLPIAFIKDCVYSYLKKRTSRSSKSISTENGAIKMFEIEIQGSINRKDSEGDISAQEEEMLLVPADTVKQSKELTGREVATYGFYIAPIWFVTEVISVPVPLRSWLELSFFFSFSFYETLILLLQ